MKRLFCYGKLIEPLALFRRNILRWNNSSEAKEAFSLLLRRRIITISSVILLGAGYAFAQDTIPSQIKEVTLFSNQALVKREAAAKVKEGVNEIFIELEAFHIDKDSVSAKVFGEGELFSVQLKEIYLKEEPQENIKALEEKIKELRDKRKVLLNRKGVLGKKEKFLDSLVDFSKTQVPQDIKTAFPETEDLEQALQFLGKSQQEINKENESLDSEIEELNKEIDVLERESASLRRWKNKSKNQIEIVFNSDKGQDIKIEASYLTYNAFWSPLYKVDVPLSLKEVNLTMFSKIIQQTGEDWNDIKLFISNVVPLRGVALPSLNSWYLDVSRPRPLDTKFSLAESPLGGAMEKEVRHESGDAIDESAEEADFVYAEKKELPLSFEYELPHALSIESKDKETILPLFSKEIKGEFFCRAVPQISPLTFLVCKATSDKELLSGFLNVYFGGRFIGKTVLGEKKPGEDFNINLGADREVKTRREKIKDKVQETFFGKIERKTIIREEAFKITVENLKERPIEIKVLDSIPVSRTDKIVVKDVKMTPPPDEEGYEDKEGVMLWEFGLKAKEKKEIDIEFVITYPKDLAVDGL